MRLYTNAELADMHLMYEAVLENIVVAEGMYMEPYPGRHLPDK